MSRLIYDKTYYLVQFIINNPIFKERVDLLTKTFTKFKLPIPNKGFTSYEDYQKWSDKYFDLHAKIQKSKKFKDKVNVITKGKKKFGRDIYDQVEELKEDELPPIYGSTIDDILVTYKVTRKHKDYQIIRDFIKYYIFFGKRDFSSRPFRIVMKRNTETNEAELFLQILPNTRKEDIENYWSFINMVQKSLPEYKERDREDKKFQRNIEIYTTYKELQKTADRKMYIGERSVDNKRLDHETMKIINKKYNVDLSWESIRTIVSNIDKLKNTVGFKDPT